MEELVGQNVFVRTLTYHYTGKVRAVSDQWLSLTDAAWVADSGRFANALSTGELNEVEPYPNLVLLALSNIVDLSPWNHELPREVR